MEIETVKTDEIQNQPSQEPISLDEDQQSIIKTYCQDISKINEVNEVNKILII